MENILECNICLEKYDRQRKTPRILKCGHTFCQSCLESFQDHQFDIENNLTDKTITCPLDKQKNSNMKSVEEIPINRLIIDILEIENQSKSNSQVEVNPSSNYIEGAKNKLKVMTEIYSESLASIKVNKETFIDNINKSLETIVHYYDSIISAAMTHKERMIKLLETYSNQKVDNYTNMIKILEQYIQLGENSLSRIDVLQKSNKKKLSIEEELRFVNGLGFESLEDKPFIKKVNSVLNEFKGRFYPEVRINDHDMIDMIQERLWKNISLIIIHDDDNNDHNSHHNQMNTINSMIQNFNLNDSEIVSNGSSASSIASFLWFQQNTPNVYLKTFSEGEESDWIKQPNTTNFTLNEMFRVCQINSEEALITGGIDNTTILNTTTLYSKGLFTKKQNMFYERRTHAMCKIDNLIYVCGGINRKNEPISFCEKYSLQYEKWSKISNMTNEKSHMSLCAFNNNYLFAFGGENKYENLLDVIEQYSILNDSWELLNIRLPIKIECCACVKKDQREIIIMGGYNNQYGSLNAVLQFNVLEMKIAVLHQILPKSGWSVFHPIKQGNVCHLFFGGEDHNEPSHIEFELVSSS